MFETKFSFGEIVKRHEVVNITTFVIFSFLDVFLNGLVYYN